LVPRTPKGQNQIKKKKNSKYRIVGTFQKYNEQIEERGKIDKKRQSEQCQINAINKLRKPRVNQVQPKLLYFL
jgi:coenzyme F420-reducing hydrogenase beta subunit